MNPVEPALLAAYRSGQRVKVRDTGSGYTRTGYVSRSTGSQPVFLLLRRRDSRGSTDVLCGHDRVIAWWDGKRYREGKCE